MALPTRCMVIPADSTQSIRTADLGYDQIAHTVNGQPGIVMLGDAPAALYINEYGRTVNADPNPRATRFTDRYVPGFAKIDMIMGDVVVIGLTDDGDEADLPTDVEALLTAGV